MLYAVGQSRAWNEGYERYKASRFNTCRNGKREVCMCNEVELSYNESKSVCIGTMNSTASTDTPTTTYAEQDEGVLFWRSFPSRDRWTGNSNVSRCMKGRGKEITRRWIAPRWIRYSTNDLSTVHERPTLPVEGLRPSKKTINIPHFLRS